MAFSYSIERRFQLATGMWVVIGNWVSGGDQTGEIDVQMNYVFGGQLTYVEPATGGIAAAPTFDLGAGVRFPTKITDSKLTIDFERDRDGSFVVYGRP